MPRRQSFLLTAAFAGLLFLLAASAFIVWRSARSTQDRIAALHTAQMEADDVLDSIRDNVYLQGILTRDYLLDPGPIANKTYRAQFEAIRAKTEDNFQNLERSGMESAQVAAIAELRGIFDAYSGVTETALSWTTEEKRARGLQVLNERVRRRQQILALAGRIEQLIANNFERQGEEITQAGEDFRSSFVWTTAIVMLLGFAIAGITLVRMTNLEHQSLAAESELRRLSGQLRTAQEEERKYLSRELHDQVGQLLTALRMELSGMTHVGVDDSEELDSRVSRAKVTVEQLMRIVRDIAMLLRPPMLDDLGLAPALAWLVRDVSRSSGIEIQAEIDPAADDLPDSYRTCLYRVVQEALTNALRHSGADNIQVILKAAGASVTAAVVDNGRGVRNRPTGQKRLGLLGMEERARELGGSLRVESSPGHGTRVEIELPRPGGLEVMNAANSHRGRPRNRTDGSEAPA